MNAINREMIESYYSITKRKEADNRKVEMPSTIKRSQDDKQLPASKKLRTCTDRARNQTEIDANQCCMCFSRYADNSTGEDWLECACGRWLHEECMEDCIHDISGQDRICAIFCMAV